MKAYRIVTSRPIVVLGVMFPYPKMTQYEKLITHADNYNLKEIALHVLTKSVYVLYIHDQLLL